MLLGKKYMLLKTNNKLQAFIETQIINNFAPFFYEWNSYILWILVQL
jgi:hypothetical protein